LDYTHFTAQRRWSDGQLRAAVANALTWTEVIDLLGLKSTSSANTRTIRAHALRLGLNTAHLDSSSTPAPLPRQHPPDLAHLSRAGSLMAAAWFELCGLRVSWPLEPARYDLLTWAQDRAERIQVKTTTTREGSTWRVSLTTSRKRVHTYGPDEIDQFFIIDGDLTYYLIPLAVVGGRKAIHLSAYAGYQLAAPGRQA
jgi:hypothetical protein